jgi:hypothetical protein
MIDHKVVLLDMVDKFWSKGIWIAQNGKSSKLDTIPNEYLNNIVLSMTNHAISSNHYDYFVNHSEDFLNKYSIDWEEIVRWKLSFHPIWPFMNKELIKRGMKLNLD